MTTDREELLDDMARSYARAAVDRYLAQIAKTENRNEDAARPGQVPVRRQDSNGADDTPTP